jgi:uncharacterized protein (DUF169 family)
MEAPMDYRSQGIRLQSLLDLHVPPVAVAFRAMPPLRVERVDHPAPAGCGYWRLAAEGRVFFTEASDHHHCPIGAHTHGVALPAERAQDLSDLLETMAQIQYIRLEEVSGIPRRRRPFGVAIYAPLIASPVDPDVVLIRGDAKQTMLLAEAVHAAGGDVDPAAQLRPTCAVVPTATEGGRASLSLGCVGNRVYTGLADHELVLAIPGSQLSEVVARLEIIVAANRTLETLHRQRQDQFSAG